ncbi:hypothetical protein FKM82_012711 [Ascaphus truei]
MSGIPLPPLCGSLYITSRFPLSNLAPQTKRNTAMEISWQVLVEGGYAWATYCRTGRISFSSTSFFPSMVRGLRRHNPIFCFTLFSLSFQLFRAAASLPTPNQTPRI